MFNATADAATPWYKHLWPWILIAMLACSVALTLSMVTIAVEHPDNLVTDNYYEAGKGIARSLEREQLAVDLKQRADVTLDSLTGEVDVQLSGASQPAQITLNLVSPTQPEKDRRIDLNAAGNGRYVGHVVDQVQGRRFVELLGVQDGKTWRLFEEEQVNPDKPLTLGDEPLQAAEAPQR